MQLNPFDDKNKCCACNACKNICPRNAIEIIKDENFFSYPKIKKDMCIDCGLCNKVCRFDIKTFKNSYDREAYAVISKDAEKNKRSSSGGFFAKLAEFIILNGGYVCGASWTYKEDGVIAKHIIVNTVQDIQLLQGSKYVQSDIGNCFTEIKKLLKEGNTVLFSGTPCQVDGLKGFLINDYENLICLDIVCHGVPNSHILNEYFSYKWPNSKVTSISFRDKKMGWGMTGYVEIMKRAKKHKYYITPNNSSFFYEFIKGNIYRENCYNCPYAGENRPADITIGDYWGVMNEHSEFASKHNDAISAVIINTQKGHLYFEHINEQLFFCESTFHKIASHNSQLRNPTIRSQKRDDLFDLYSKIGYKAFENDFKSNNNAIAILRENIKLHLKVLRMSLKNVMTN